MKKEFITEICEKARKTIADAEAALRTAQAACKHEDTFEGQWSWRIGSTNPATICSICGGLVKLHIPILHSELLAQESDARKDK